MPISTICDQTARSFSLGNGAGQFWPPQPYSYPAGASLFSAGEFNGDGRLDLVTIYQGAWDAASAVVVEPERR